MNFKTRDLQAYAIAGTQDLPDQQLLPFLKKALEAGITTFQLREKGPAAVNDRQTLVTLAKACRQLTAQYQVPFIIDDDVALALEVGADGVHVGQKDQPIETVLKQAHQRLIVGYSCETSAQVNHANQLTGIDYLGCGAVFPTVSKADAENIGLTQLRQLTTLSTYPVVAIGGITLENTAQVLKAGAAGVSGITLFTQSSDLTQTLTQLLAHYQREV